MVLFVGDGNGGGWQVEETSAVRSFMLVSYTLACTLHDTQVQNNNKKMIAFPIGKQNQRKRNFNAIVSRISCNPHEGLLFKEEKPLHK